MFLLPAGLFFGLIGFFFFLPNYFLMRENTYDLMFIDNTHDENFFGPFGKVTSESEQFQAWKKPMKQAFEECVKEKGHAAHCLDGINVTIAVFNVTNAVEILKGDMASVQELGPISLKMYVNKIDIDKPLWDATGVAKFRQDTTYELNKARCDKACKDLLEEKIIVPNPAWATVSAMGAEFVVAAIAAVTDLPTKEQDPKMVFGLTDDEVAPFMQVFVWEEDMDRKLKTVGEFLATASAAAQQDAKLYPTCQLGGLTLSGPQCIKIITKLEEIIPSSWEATINMISAMDPLYGEAGGAAPVFIKVRVKEALGFDGATFSDPLMKMSGLSFAAAHSHKPPQSDPPGLFRHVQMASKFGKKGTGYYTKYNSAAHDCRWDRDCVLASASIDSCESSDICTPNPLTGYMGYSFPGRVFDDVANGTLFWQHHRADVKVAHGFPFRPLSSFNGFDDLDLGPSWGAQHDDIRLGMMKSEKTFRALANGMALDLAAIRRGTIFVPSRVGHRAFNNFPRPVPDGLVRYVELIPWNLNPRIENCDGKEPGSPGFDCGGPRHTINLAPATMGVPLYFSMPYFDNRLLTKNKEADKRAKRWQGYHPASRVSITRCTANSNWCNETSFSKYNSSVWVEPETGKTFRMQLASQMNVRLGFANGFLYPHIMDQLVPVFWQAETVDTPSQLRLEEIYDLQDASLMLSSMVFATLSFSNVFCVFGVSCFLSYHLHKKGVIVDGQSERVRKLQQEDMS